MPRYRYTAYTPKGDILNGELEAQSNTDALSVLNQKGLHPYITEKLDGVGEVKNRSYLWALRNKITVQDYANFSRELATLVQAELPLDESLRLMAGHKGNKKLAKLTSTLLTHVVAGTPLSTALQEHADNAPLMMESMIRAGEARGDLGTALSDLASFLEARIDTQSKISSALTYPIILTVTAIFTIAIIISVLVPTLLPLFEDTGAVVPPALAAGNWLSVQITEHWLAISLALLIIVLAGWKILRIEAVRRLGDRLALKLPLIGSLVTKHNLFMFARMLGTLLRNGVPLIQALQVSASVVPNRNISSLIQAAVQPVQEGQRLAEVLTQSKSIPETAISFIAIGEESSRLDDMLLHMAKLYEKETSQQLERVMTMLTPAITVMIGIVVGGLILSVMQAILGVNDLALQ